jgi:CHAT domain
VSAPSWLSARTVVPALALSGGLVMLLLLVLLRLPVTEALACAAVSAAAMAAAAGGYLRIVASAFAVTAGQGALLAAASAASLAVPAAAVLGRHADGPVTVAGTALVAVCAAGSTARGARTAERDRLSRDLVTGQSPRQSLRLARTCERLLAGGLAGRARACVELNLAAALNESMMLVPDPAAVPGRVLDLLGSIRRDPGLEPAFAVLAARLVMDAANAHATSTGDLGTYEAAVREASAELTTSPLAGRSGPARMLLTRADLLVSHAQQDFDAAIGGAPQRSGQARARLAEALRLLDAAAGADPGVAREAGLMRAGVLMMTGVLLRAEVLMRASALSSQGQLDESRETLAAAVAETRRQLAAPAARPLLMRGMAVLWLAVAAGQAAELDADDRLLDEALGHVRSMLRHRIDPALRSRLLAQQARLKDLRSGSDSDSRLEPRLRDAAERGGGSPFGLLRLRTEIAEAAAATGSAPRAAAAYQEALDLMRDQAARSPVRQFRRGALAAGRGLAAEAAFWLAEDRRPAEAVVALESGRAVSATQVIEREVTLARLRDAGHAGLAQRFAQCLARLGALERQEPESQVADAAPRWRRDLDDAGRQYVSLRAEIQAADGFGRAFRPPDFPAIAQAARDRPVVYLAAARDGGIALVVDRADPRAVPRAVELPGLTAPDLDAEVRLYREGLAALRAGRTGEWRVRLTGMRDWLAAVTGPLWAQLAGGPVVTVIPAGALSLLPVHVIQPDGAPAVALAPNARIVASLSGRPPGPVPRRVLVVDSPDERWHLPAAQVTADVTAIRSLSAQALVLSGDDATRAAVLAQLPRWNAYHFSCHGQADDENPMASGLLLRDGLLTVADILAARVPDARLAVLSACESGVPGADAFDEVVGLPAALMEAGIRGIIGSLWAVQPVPASLLTRRFYAEWDAGVHPAAALRRAQAWLRQVTNGELAQYGDIAPPERLTGPAAQAWPGTRPFAHPDAWAAFTYTGI